MSTGSRNAFGLPEDQVNRGAGYVSPADAARAAAEAGKRRKVVRRKPVAADDATPAAGTASPAAAAVAAREAAPVAAFGTLAADERRTMRRKVGALSALLAVLFVVSLCGPDSSPRFISLGETLQIYGLRIQQLWAHAFDPTAVIPSRQIISMHPTYSWTLLAAARTAVYAICGALLALSGALFQNVFRNPIASPSMLGVSNGVQLAMALLVLATGGAGFGLGLRYGASFAAVAITLGVLFGLSALMSGRGRPLNVVNMLIVGTIINQFVNIVVTYITFFLLDDLQYEAYVNLTTLVMPSGELSTWIVLGFAVLAGLVPVLLMRFRMNALNFRAEEMRVFGVNAAALQFAALVIGTVVMVVSQLQVGMVAMITLIVPHLARALFGAEFRKQLAGTLLIGAIVLLACHIIVLIIPNDASIPLGMVVNVLLLPAFVWMIALQQRRWE